VSYYLSIYRGKNKQLAQDVVFRWKFPPIY
jgi:hypothetical protein